MLFSYQYPNNGVLHGKTHHIMVARPLPEDWSKEARFQKIHAVFDRMLDAEKSGYYPKPDRGILIQALLAAGYNALRFKQAVEKEQDKKPINQLRKYREDLEDFNEALQRVEKFLTRYQHVTQFSNATLTHSGDTSSESTTFFAVMGDPEMLEAQKALFGAAQRVSDLMDKSQRKSVGSGLRSNLKVASEMAEAYQNIYSSLAWVESCTYGNIVYPTAIHSSKHIHSPETMFAFEACFMFRNWTERQKQEPLFRLRYQTGERRHC